jgi:hypothetical protein
MRHHERFQAIKDALKGGDIPAAVKRLNEQGATTASGKKWTIAGLKAYLESYGVKP